MADEFTDRQRAMLDRIRGHSSPLEPGGTLDPAAPLRTGTEVAPSSRPTESGPFDAESATRNALEIGMSLAGPGAVGKVLTRHGVNTGVKRFGGQVAGGGAGGALGSFAAEPFDPTEVPALSALEAGGRGAAGEAGGALLRVLGAPIGRRVTSFLRDTPVFRRVFGPSRKLEAGAEKAVELVQREGATPTAGQLLDGRTVDVVENILDSALLGGGVIKATRDRAEDTATGLVGRFVASFRNEGGEVATGKVLQDAIRGSTETFDAAVTKAYSKVDEITGTAPVDLGDMSGAIKRVTGEDLFFGRSPQVNVADAKAIANGLRNLGPEANVLALKVEASISKAAGRLTPEAKKALDVARALEHSGAEVFNNKVVRGLVKQADPELVYRAGVRNMRPSQISRVRRLVDNEKTWEAVQGRYLRDVLQRSTDDSTRVLSGEKILRELGKTGDESLFAMFPKSEHLPLRTLARTLAITQAKAGGDRTGSMFIQLTQAGAVIGLATDQPFDQGREAAAAILLGPAILSRVLTNPTAVRALTTGITHAPGSILGSRALSQFITHLDNLGVLNDPEVEIDPSVLKWHRSGAGPPMGTVEEFRQGQWRRQPTPAERGRR